MHAVLPEALLRLPGTSSTQIGQGGWAALVHPAAAVVIRRRSLRHLFSFEWVVAAK